MKKDKNKKRKRKEEKNEKFSKLVVINVFRNVLGV